MFTRHQLYQLYEEGREPTVRLIESLLDYIEELKHDPQNRQQRQITNLAERIGKLAARLKRVEEKLARQQCLNYELKRRIAELEEAAVVRDSHNSSLPPALDPPAAKAANAIRRTRSLRRPSGRLPGGQVGHRGHTRPRVEQPDQQEQDVQTEQIAIAGLPQLLEHLLLFRLGNLKYRSARHRQFFSGHQFGRTYRCIRKNSPVPISCASI